MLESVKDSRRILIGSIGLIFLAGAICYSNSLRGEFVFDDLDAIYDNESIKTLDPFTNLFPPPGTTASGRPLLNLSLAVNFALGEYDVLSYHLFNVLIHLANAVILFLLVRGTLERPCVPERFRACASGIALAVALLWVVHPLQTEIVSYIVQRGEALAAMFLLLTFYFLLRGAEWSETAGGLLQSAAKDSRLIPRYQQAAQRASRCYLLAVVSCFLGVLSKEILVVAPVLALLYDRIFLAGTFRQAIRSRAWLHTALCSSWILLGVLIISAKGRGGTVGFGLGISPVQYAISQTMWILHYIRLTFWPSPLVFDYGFQLSSWDLSTQVSTCVILLLLGVTIGVLVERPALGFLPLAFFAILAPTSSIVPIATQVAAERRMYLALAPVLILIVLSVVVLGGRLPLSGQAKRILAGVLLAGSVLALGATTFQRNRDYRTALGLWSDTLAKVPDNPRAESNYGQELLRYGNGVEALAHLRRAVELLPHYEAAECVLGIALIKQGLNAEAIRCFRGMLEFKPDNPIGMINLAAAYQANRQYPEAIEWYRKALEEQPNNAEAHLHLGQVLMATGREPEAMAQFRTAVQLDPRLAARLGQ